MELVSVIIAAYNCQDYIRMAVDSIRNQTYSNLEILVCDDQSTDLTWSILKSYSDPRMKIFRNDVNRGVVDTRNFLLKMSTGNYIAIQDADDWSSLERIELQLQFFRNSRNLGACGTAHFKINNKGISERVGLETSFYLTWDSCRNLPFMPASLMISRKVYDHLGGYHSFFTGLFAEDLYWIIVILGKFDVYYFNTPLYFYRFNANSITNSFNAISQLAVKDVLDQVIDQRKRTGDDWISKGETDQIENFKTGLFKNKKWLSEQYRVVAAIQRDGKKRLSALRLIICALRYNPMSMKNYVTLRYILFF